MLVLSRRRDERIVIDRKITVMIVEIRSDKVRIGIEAPKDVEVHREEVLERIQLDEQRNAQGQAAGEDAAAFE